MSTNDQTKEAVEPTQEEVPEQPTEQTEETPETVSKADFDKLQSKLKTLEIQRMKAMEKLKGIKEEQPKKQESSSEDVILEKAFLFSQGYTKDEIKLASEIALKTDKPLSEVAEDEYFQFKVNKRKQEEKSEKAALGTSNSSFGVKGEKSFGEMSPEEHRAAYMKAIGS